MIGYTYWEQGRDIAKGKIVSMTPIDFFSRRGDVGGIEFQAAGMAVSAIAQFGMYLEMRKMTQLAEAQFEERRHGWIDSIITQWIDEHRNSSGIRRDVTGALVRECGEMWKKLYENEKIDVPQTILLKVSRMVEFIQWNYLLLAVGVNALVEASGSDEGWLINEDAKASQIADEVLHESIEEKRSTWWKGALKAVGGLPLLLVPVVGPVAGGGAVGYGIGEMMGCINASRADLARLEDKRPLLELHFAVSLLEAASSQLTQFMTAQNIASPARLLVADTGSSQASFLLKPVSTWARTPKLRALPFTDEV